MADVKPIAADPVAGLIDIPMPREVSLLPQTWEARLAIAQTSATALENATLAIWLRFCRECLECSIFSYRASAHRGSLDLGQRRIFASWLLIRSPRTKD